MWSIGSNSFSRILSLWIIIHGICGYWMVVTSITTTHHHPEIWISGNEGEVDRDWGLFQLKTTKEIDKSKSLFLISVTFGDHLLHHLFPTVDHSKLYLIYPILEQTLKDFNINDFSPFKSPFNLICGYHQSLAKIK